MALAASPTTVIVNLFAVGIDCTLCILFSCEVVIPPTAVAPMMAMYEPLVTCAAVIP